MKKVFVASYGGAHSQALIPIVEHLNNDELWNVEILGLTYAHRDFYEAGFVETWDFDSILRAASPRYEQLIEIGDKILPSGFDPTVGYENTRAYYGSGFLDLVDKEGMETGTAKFLELERKSFFPIQTAEEILAFISSPTYNPSGLTGKQLDKTYRELVLNPNNPLFNRPLMAKYPPGSIFKIAMALAALDAGIITEDTYYSCGGGFWRNKGKPGCRMHVTPLKIDNAIKFSCNSFFAATYMDYLHHASYDSIYAAYEEWYGYMSRMGIGHPLEVDLPYEKGGSLPTSAMYDDEARWYGHNRWSATTIISNSIGQGEIEMTPLQMANLASLVANRGKYYPPHFLVAIRNSPEQTWVREPYELINTQIDERHVETVIDAMEEVVSTGTGRRAFLQSYPVCGKTGTVENSHGEDHATFIGFAPRNNPRIAVAVIIENAGGGGTWAAPTASILMEQYLTGKVEEKQWEMQRLLNADFIEEEE